MLYEERLNEQLEEELISDETMLEFWEEKLREILAEPRSEFFNVLNELFDGHGWSIVDRP
jgi:hypothetical protein